VETTEPINGDDIGAIADSLIMDAPSNSDNATQTEATEAVDEQAEQLDATAENQDDVDTSSDDELELDDDVADIEIEELEANEEPLYTVKVDGKEKQVTLDELTRGYSGQEYIQKGMAENAEARKAVEKLIETTTKERQVVAQERQQLQTMMQQLQQEGIPSVPEYPSEELRASDPLGYLEAEAEYRRAMDKRSAWEQQAQALAQQQQQQQQKEQAQRLEHEAARLAEWMPEFADPQKRDAVMLDITTKAKKHYNLTEEMLSTVQTAEEVAILRDALRYREAVARKDSAKAKVADKPPVAKPSAKKSMQVDKQRSRKQAKARMQKNGGIDDVANFLIS
jgi:hypothetical protein